MAPVLTVRHCKWPIIGVPVNSSHGQLVTAQNGMTSWPPPQRPRCHCCDELTACCCPYTYDITPLSMERIRLRDVTRRLDSRWCQMWDDSFRRVSCTSSNLVSVPRRPSCSSRYMFSCPRLALWCRRRCQPSRSLLDRTLRLNTDDDKCSKQNTAYALLFTLFSAQFLVHFWVMAAIADYG